MILALRTPIAHAVKARAAPMTNRIPTPEQLSYILEET